MAKKTLLLLVTVNEDELPPGDAYTALPDKIDAAIATSLPGIDLSSLYLLGTKSKKLIERIANDTAINYHHYAVTVRGEKCQEKDCEQHPVTNVLDFHDHRKGHRTTQRPN